MNHNILIIYTQLPFTVTADFFLDIIFAFYAEMVWETTVITFVN